MDKKFNREEGWIKNCLRHSFGTYYSAYMDNYPLVVREMNNSVSVIKRHYDGVTTKTEAEKHFNILPKVRKLCGTK